MNVCNMDPQCFCCTTLRDVLFTERCSVDVISTTIVYYKMQWYAGSPQLVSEKIALTLVWKPSKGYYLQEGVATIKNSLKEI